MSWYKSPMKMFLLCSDGSVYLWKNFNLAGRWSVATFFFFIVKSTSQNVKYSWQQLSSIFRTVHGQDGGKNSEICRVDLLKDTVHCQYRSMEVL